MNNYDACLQMIKNTCTDYERQFNITTDKLTELIKKDDISFIVGEKSDGVKTLFIVLRISKKYDSWVYLTLSDTQIDLLSTELFKHYKIVDEHNKNKRRRG